MLTDFEKDIAERNRALANLDMEYARKMFPGASSDYVRLAAMHKARYEMVSLPAELRHESGLWLRLNGFKRLTGQDLLPEGELPE